MDDMDRALFEAFEVVWGRIKGDEGELPARLARRRSAEMGRPPRAWCLAVRASDRRIDPGRTAIVSNRDARKGTRSGRLWDAVRHRSGLQKDAVGTGFG